MTWEITPFLAADIGAARALWQATPGIGLSAADEPAALAAYLARNAGLSRLARDGETLLGTLLCGHDGRRGLFHHLAVAPAARGLGIGRALVRAGLDGLREAGIGKCYLTVQTSNPDGAAFWRRLGAEERTAALTFFSMTP
jgi:ribosomal protein S18 acetylase RimI-like enzyme